MTQPIAFIDSGVGGLPYLEWVKNARPEESYVYVADTKNFPYGEKKSDSLKKTVEKLVYRLVEKHNPKLLVIACNTASVTTLDHLRSLFSFPIVGVVPAVKPAALGSKNRKIGVLATRRTVEAPYVDSLVNHFADHCEVIKVAAGNIVSAVENMYLSTGPDLSASYQGPVQSFINSGVDTVVLGCTHFLHIDKELQQALGSSIRVIDSREGVGKQVLRLLGESTIATNDQEDIFYITDDREPKQYQGFCNKYKLIWGGLL